MTQMKKLNLFIVFIFGFLTLSCSSDDGNSDDGNNDDNSNTNQKLIKKITISQNGDLQLIYTFEYNNAKLISLTEESNNKTEYNYNEEALSFERRLAYDFNSNTYNSEFERTDFEYTNGILISDLVTENDTPIQRHDYIINGDGKITQYDFFNFFNNQWNSGGSRFFEYSSGNISEEIQADNNGDVVFKYQYTYDNQNHPLINLDIQIRRQLWGYRLNSMNDNNILSYTSLDENNNIQSSFSYTYQYDSDDYPVQREKIDLNNDQVIETIDYEYE